MTTINRRPKLPKITLSTALLSLAFAGLPLAASAADDMVNGSPKPPAAASQSRQSKPLLPISPPPTPRADNAKDDEPVPAIPGMQVFEGSGSFISAPAVKQTGTAPGDVTLDFTDADIRDVVRAVIGDILQKSYTIDPKITGRITLKTGRPISKDAVIPALETALKINGAAINRTQDIYNVVPIADAQHHSQMTFGNSEGATAGYGIEIVPLEYISAEDIQRVIAPLIPESAIAQVDTKRNLIFFTGTEPERAAIRDMIARFDVNYLKGMSFALIQPSHANAETLANELDKIFGEANSPISGLVRLVPISRINSLLIITSRRAYLKEVQRWVARLDIAPVTPDRKIYFYRLQNARARDVAEILGRLFGGNFFSGPMENANTPAPPTQPTTSRFNRPNGLNSNSSMPLMGNVTQATPQSTQSNAPPTFANGPFGGAQTTNGPQIVTDESNNALIIRADAANYAAIEDVIKQMDVTPNQVMVEATIVEVTLNDTLKYGVEWYFKNADQTYTMSPNGSVLTHFPGLGITYTVPNIKVALSALGSLTAVTVLSSPKILTLDNKAATIEVGDQIPIVTQTAVSTTTSDAPIVSSVEQRDTGVILSVTPRIGNSGIVYLDVSQEVSTSTQTTSSNIDSPTIQQRRIKSTVAVNDGATIALGGLMQNSDTRGDGGVPYLKDIPLLGGLFSTKSGTRAKTELLVFLTPHVIRNLPAALDVTSRLKQEMHDIQDALDDLPSHKVPRRPW